MVQLILMRHGVAAPGMRDRERPLDERGRMQTRMQGASLAAHIGKVSCALVSPARRTRQSFENLQVGGLDVEQVRWCEALYSGGYTQVLEKIRTCGKGGGEGGCASLLVVGHEPTLSQLIFRLAVPESCARMQVAWGFSTAMAVVGELEEWESCGEGNLQVSEVLRAHV